jgi:tetratricopeptide (TPR) repeat protein
MRSAALVLALALAPLPAWSGVDDRERALAHYKAGQELMFTEKWEEAAAEFSEATQLDPLFGQAFHDLGLCRMALREYPAALKAFSDSREAFQKLWELQSTDSTKVDMRIEEEITSLRDAIRFVQTSVRPDQLNPFTVMKYQDRITELERQRHRGASGVFEIPAPVSLGLGSAYLRMGQLEEAEHAYRDAIKVRPKFGEAHNNLAVIYLRTGRIPEAQKEVQLAEKSGFTVPPGLKADIKAAAKK